jgi:galactonate dehydratase
VNAGSLNWVFCKVYTNGGLVGLGEGSVTSKEATVAQAIMEHERYLAGKDPTDIELLWQGMFRNPRWRGGPILNSAISAVEIALWDILGQALGVPVYKLLGGAARTRIRMYLDVGSTPEEFLRAKELGYTAAKTTPLSPNSDMVQPTAMIRAGVRKVAAIRQAVGDDFDIAVDAHGRCDDHGGQFLHAGGGVRAVIRRGTHPTGRPGRACSAAREDENPFGDRRAQFHEVRLRGFLLPPPGGLYPA